MTTRDYVEWIAVLTIPLAVLGMIVNRIWTGKGFGVRAIQFLAVATFTPAVLVLALERIIDGSTVAALVGAFVGYLFSNIADFDRRPSID
jgi:hypothetical protein